MFMSLLSHLLGAWFAFALPCYSTYKALSHDPSPDALRALSVYWAVTGAFVAFEQTLGRFLSWLPFYWELRTIFLLYISLPQTNGSAYVYKTLLEPWCSKNEHDIDDAMASVQTNAIAFCRSRIAILVDLVPTLLNQASVSAQVPSNGDTHNPATPLDQLKGLWTIYGPSVLTAFASKDIDDAQQQLMRQTRPAEMHSDLSFRLPTTILFFFKYQSP